MASDGGFFTEDVGVCFPYSHATPGRIESGMDDLPLGLEQFVNLEIGPRLLMFHHQPFSAPPPDERPTQDDIERLAILAIGRDETATAAHFEKVRDQRHSYTNLLAYFLAPAARYMGELWKQDLCDFCDVTIGVGRLQTLMDGMATPEPLASPDINRRAMLIALPGEDHVMGVRLVAKILEASGWDVTLEDQLSAEHNAMTIAGEWIGVVGVSLSAATRVELAARTVALVRRASLNPSVAVMAGGNAIVDHPELALQIGADAVGLDAPTAALLASHLLSRQSTAALATAQTTG